MKRTLSMILAILMVVAIFATVGMANGETEPTGEPEAVETAAPAAEEPAPAAEEPAPATEEPIAPIAEEPADSGIAPASELPAPISMPDTTEIPEASPDKEWVILDCAGGTFQGYSLFPFDLVDGKLVDGIGWYQPERPGYRFLGWFQNQGQTSGTPLKKGDTVEPGSTLYAGWVRAVVLDAEPGNFWDTGKQEENNYTRTVDLTDGDKFPGYDNAPLFDISKTADEQTVVFDGWYTEKCTVSETNADGYWTLTIKNGGTKVNVNDPVDPGVTVLYAGYRLKNEQPAVKAVTYYYDWNGIDGMYGHCLTSSRAYEENVQGHTLTAEDLLIRYLNWNGENEKSEPPFTPKTQEELNQYWEGKEFNGYTFKGWSTESPQATAPNVEAGKTVAQNGTVLYAVWTKGDESNATFERESGEPKDLTVIRFPSGYSVSQSVHVGSTVNLPLDVLPANGKGDITWTLKVYNASNLRDLLKGECTVFTVNNVGEVSSDGAQLSDFGITVTVSGRSLNVKSEKQLTVTVSAAVVGHPDVCTNFDATVSFSHNPGEWKQVKAPTCTERGKEETTCTYPDCNELLARDIAPLEHVWGTKVTKEATCTEAGQEEKACLRDKCDVTYKQYLAGEGFSSTLKAETIPPLGHTYEVKKTGVENGVPVYTKTCIHHDATETFKGGDVNGDGRVTNMDVTMLFNIVNERTDGEVDGVAGDVTGDGRVTNMDVTKLFNFVNERTNSLE